MTDDIALLEGTQRVRAPEETWDVMAPKFARFGITRIADVTGLDFLGIPVAMAVRPLARSLSVAQGKGQTLILAKVSALMESIEHWHAENAPPPAIRAAPARLLDLPYQMSDLDTLPGSLLTEHTRLDWIDADGMVTGRSTPVPLGSVCLAPPDRRRWTPFGLNASSNGLASGNSAQEAALHALYEVIERDALRGWSVERPGRILDAASVDDPGCATMLAKLRSAGAVFQIDHVPSRFGVPCFAAWIWTEDFPVPCLGFGAHLAPEVALSRAVTEAAQSRLTTIAGSREDLSPVYEQVQQGAGERPEAGLPAVTWDELTAVFGGAATLGEDLTRLSTAVANIVGFEPLLVDLSTDADFAVVKALAPGTGADLNRFHASS